MTEFEREADELRTKQKLKMKDLRDNMEANRKRITKIIEENNNKKTEELKGKHIEKFKKIKEHYQDIIQTNLDIIKNYKDKVQEMKREEAKYLKKLNEIEMANKE